MNTRTHRSTFGIAAALAIAALALIGCTDHNSGLPGGGLTGAPYSWPVAAQTYTESDLVRILTTANSRMQVDGTVQNLGPVAASRASTPDSLYARILARGGTMTPAECGPLLDKFTKDALTFGNNPGAYSASLTYGTTVITATSAAEPQTAKGLAKLISADVDSMDSKCPTMTFAFPNPGGTTTQYTLTFAKSQILTSAGLSPTYTEVTTSGTTTVQTLSGFAMAGNLEIGFAGLSSATTFEDFETGINAVYFAAKDNNG